VITDPLLGGLRLDHVIFRLRQKLGRKSVRKLRKSGTSEISFNNEYGSEMPVDLSRPPSRAQRRKARTESTILGAAETLFLERGFHGVTVEQVAEAADVAVGSIYVHFDSKEGLYLALLERAFEVERSYMEAALDSGSAPLQQLLLAGDAYLRFYFENPGYFRILVWPHVDARPGDELPEAAQRLAERAEQQVVRLAEVLAACQKEGLVRDGDPYKVAKFMWGAWNGVIALNLRPDRLRLEDDELRAVIAEGRRVLAEGIATQAVRNPDGTLLTDISGTEPS
jgi:TetR/AcrR family transcriptional regulator